MSASAIPPCDGDDIGVGFLQDNGDSLWQWATLDWATVYGTNWSDDATNLSRYFVKQFGCMMATQRLPVPPAAIDFLDGSERCPPLGLGLSRDHRPIQLHRRMQRTGDAEGILSFIGLPPTHAYGDRERLTGADYQCRLAYLLFDVAWREGADTESFHESQIVSLPLINARLHDRLRWLPVGARSLAHRARNWWRQEMGE